MAIPAQWNIPTNVNVPDFGGAVGNFLEEYKSSQDRGEQQRQRNVLRDVGAAAASGDYLAGSKVAFKGGNVALGVQMAGQQRKINEGDQDRMYKAVDFFSKRVTDATTPGQLNSIFKVAGQAGIFSPEVLRKLQSMDPDAMKSVLVNQAAQMKAALDAAKLAKTKAETNKAGYMKAGDSIFKLPEEGDVPSPQGVGPTSQLAPVYKAPLSERDQVKLEIDKLRRGELQASEDRGFATKTYAQKFDTGLALGLNNEAAGMFASGAITIKTDPINKKPIAYDAFGRELDINKLMAPSAEQPQQGQAQPMPIGAPGIAAQPTAGGQTQFTQTQSSQRPDYTPPPLPEIDPQDTLFARVPLITGAYKSTGEFITQLPGTGEQNPDTMDAMADFDNIQRKIKSVFSLSRRFPVYEQKIIASLFGRGFWTKTGKLQAKLASLDDYLAEEMEVQTGVANDTDMPVEDRRDAINFIKKGQSLRAKLGVPRKVSPEEARTLAPGSVFRTMDGRLKIVPQRR